MGLSLAFYGNIPYYSIVGGSFAHLDKIKKVYKHKGGNVKMIKKVHSTVLYSENGSSNDVKVVRVVYESKSKYGKNRISTFSGKDNLPLTVVEFMLNAGSVETVYIGKNEVAPGFMGGKREIYSNK